MSSKNAGLNSKTSAYSYIRFSHPDQKKGDTLRRQTAARDAWLDAHPDVDLDTSLRMTDEGRSGFRRKNWDTYALAELVAYVKEGRVPPGSFLLVESLDRISREEVGDATELFLSIVNRGVVVVQLTPVVMEFRRPVNAYSLMFAVMELSRGHGESAIKSERLSAAWGNKKGKARESRSVETTRVPGWLTVKGRRTEGKHKVGGSFRVIRPRVKVVERIFRLATEGAGLARIVPRLTKDRAPTWGRAGPANGRKPTCGRYSAAGQCWGNTSRGGTASPRASRCPVTSRPSLTRRHGKPHRTHSRAAGTGPARRGRRSPIYSAGCCGTA